LTFSHPITKKIITIIANPYDNAMWPVVQKYMRLRDDQKNSVTNF